MNKFVSILLTIVFFTSCYNLLGPSDGQRLLTTFELRDTTGQPTQSFAPGEDIFFHYRMQNLKAKDLDFKVQDTGPIVTFEVRKDGKLVGTSDDGFGYAEVIVDSVLRGQSEIEHSYNWLLQDDLHRSLESGHYVAKAVPRLWFDDFKTPAPDSISFYVECEPDSDCSLLPPVRLTDRDPAEIELSQFRLNSVALRGKTLTLNISYGGGCEEHGFELFMSPAAFMESFPVQANIYLRHDNNNDFCKAYITEDISFDISPIVDAYLQAYGGRLDPIILNVMDFSGNDNRNNITVKFIPEEDVSTIIRSGTSFGFCAGYCINELTIIGTEVDFIAIGWPPQTRIPDRLLEGTITESEYQALLDAIDMQVLFELDDIIGCPDCADGGAEWIEVTNNEGVRKVTFEYNADIPEIRPLLEQVRVIRERFRDEMFPPDTN
jgi:hypothetical protein